MLCMVPAYTWNVNASFGRFTPTSERHSGPVGFEHQRIADRTDRAVRFLLNWSSMRRFVEYLMHIWPINRLITLIWRYFPFPRGVRPRIMRLANDRFLVGVMAVILDEDNRLLLVRNTYDPRFSWGLPGGWMGRDEQPEECIRREILEETGFELEVDRLLATRTHSRLPSVDIVYRGWITGGAFRQSAEIAEAAYFPIDNLPDGLTPIHQRLLEWLEIDEVPQARESHCEEYQCKAN
jgi:8-oxo-dGTP diphosphatase